MSSSETTILRQGLLRVILHYAGSSGDSHAVVAAARCTYDELRAVFAPLISSAGVEALLARAFDITRREYPANEQGSDPPSEEPFLQITQWLERQGPAVARDAAAAMFARFATLLAALIGQPLTTRYLTKAWPGTYADAGAKENKA